MTKVKIKESKSLTEIKDIRREISEETKNMSSDEYLAYINRSSQELLEKYGIELPRYKK